MKKIRTAVKLSIRELRELVRESIVVEATPGKPYIRNVLSPDTSDREQITSLNDLDVDTELDPEGVAPHLRDVAVDAEDCYGPVPPGDGVARGSIDPYTRDVWPSSRMGR